MQNTDTDNDSDIDNLSNVSDETENDKNKKYNNETKNDQNIQDDDEDGINLEIEELSDFEENEEGEKGEESDRNNIKDLSANDISGNQLNITNSLSKSKKFIATKFTSKGITFDIVVDDGPHTLESMIQFITLYLPLLKADGILVIEDVQDIAWLETLTQVTPDAFKPYIQKYDRRSVKGRYDDIMFVINKACVE